MRGPRAVGHEWGRFGARVTVLACVRWECFSGSLVPVLISGPKKPCRADVDEQTPQFVRRRPFSDAGLCVLQKLISCSVTGALRATEGCRPFTVTFPVTAPEEWPSQGCFCWSGGVTGAQGQAGPSPGDAAHPATVVCAVECTRTGLSLPAAHCLGMVARENARSEEIGDPGMGLC